MEEIREFCFKEFAAVCLFWNFFVLWLLIILLIKAKCDMLIAAVLFWKGMCGRRAWNRFPVDIVIRRKHDAEDCHGAGRADQTSERIPY